MTLQINLKLFLFLAIFDFEVKWTENFDKIFLNLFQTKCFLFHHWKPTCFHWQIFLLFITREGPKEAWRVKDNILRKIFVCRNFLFWLRLTLTRKRKLIVDTNISCGEIIKNWFPLQKQNLWVERNLTQCQGGKICTNNNKNCPLNF